MAVAEHRGESLAVGHNSRADRDETKHASKTSELWAAVALAAGVLIAGLAIDGFDAGRVWLYVTILAVAYMVSRGFAKSQRARDHDEETKDSFKTTEFYVFVATLVGLLIAGVASDGQGSEVDTLEGARVWLCATILGAGYVVSRGLAKSGSAARNDRDRDENRQDVEHADAPGLHGGNGHSTTRPEPVGRR